MGETDIIKGVQTLKDMVQNLCSIMDFCKNNHIPELYEHINKMQKDCGVLTDILEKAFGNMIEEKERMTDDGK